MKGAGWSFNEMIQIWIQYMLRIKFETSREEGDYALNNMLRLDSPKSN